MRTEDIKIRFEPPETWAADYPMGSAARTNIYRDEGLVYIFVGGNGGGPLHRITFTSVGFQRFAEFIAHEAASE